MSLKKFTDEAKEKLKALEPLAVPIRDLPKPHWSRQLSKSGESTSELADLREVTLTGQISAAAHLTRRSEPPLDLARIQGDKDESSTAFASLVVAGTAGANLTVEQPLGEGTMSAGAAAGSTVRWAQHRRVTSARKGVNAFHDLLTHIALIYDPDQVEKIGEADVLQSQISGTAAVRADAGWEWGLVRTFSGGTLDTLGIEEPMSIAAGVAVGATVTAGIEGELRVVVTHSPKSHADHPIVLVSLYKRRGAFAGAGINVTAGLSIENAVRFVDAVADRILEIPDGLIEELEAVQGQLKQLKEKLDGLADEARAAVEAAAGKSTDALRLDEIREVLARPELAPFAAQLSSVAALVDKVQGWIDKADSAVDGGIDRVVGHLMAPLNLVDGQIGTWLSAYAEFRTLILENVKRRALEGIKLEIEAGINRTWANESLLDLEIDLKIAPGPYRQAVKGNFAPALQAARAGGSNGVEILSGSLKEITRTDRHFNLSLNLFGFEIQRNLRDWKELEIAEDAISGEITLVGQAGAELWASRGSQIRALSFLVDAAEVTGAGAGQAHFSSNAGFAGTLVRSAEFKNPRHIQKLMPKHLKGAQALRLIGPEDRELLEDKILAATGDYAYELRLSFPAASMRRLFQLDAAGESQKSIAQGMWATIANAVDILDLPVPTGQRFCPLSRTFSAQNIAFVSNAKTGDWDKFKPTRVEDYKFERGQARLIWVYLRESYLFIRSYLEAREALLSGNKAGKQLSKLRDMTANVSRPTGALSTMPFDAKYLALALVVSPAPVQINWTVKRGKEMVVRL